MIKDRRQGIGQNSNHRQHDEGDVLVHRRLFEMRASRQGLECGGVDGPTASAQLVNELRRDGSEFHIARIKVGALKRDLFFLFVSPLTWLLNSDALDLLDTDCFDHTHATVGDRPVDVKQMPKREIFVTGRPLARGGSRRETFGLSQQSRLIVFQINHPVQAQRFDRGDERRLQINSVGNEHIEEPPPQMLGQFP